MLAAHEKGVKKAKKCTFGTSSFDSRFLDVHPMSRGAGGPLAHITLGSEAVIVAVGVGVALQRVVDLLEWALALIRTPIQRPKALKRVILGAMAMGVGAAVGTGMSDGWLSVAAVVGLTSAGFEWSNGAIKMLERLNAQRRDECATAQAERLAAEAVAGALTPDVARRMTTVSRSRRRAPPPE